MFLSVQRQRKRKVAEESMAAKERYMKFWKDKLASIYTEQAETIVEVARHKQEGKKQLQRLQEQELRIMQEINQYHSQHIESKKQYLAALSLPVKEVAEAMSNSKNASMISRRKSMTINNSALDNSNQASRSIERDAPKLPKAQVNQDKLKVILQQLKKIDRSAIHTSR